MTLKIWRSLQAENLSPKVVPLGCKLAINIVWLVVLFVSGCKPALLTETEARRLVESQPDFADGVYCNLSTRIAGVVNAPVRVVDRPCADALNRVGLATVGAPMVARFQFDTSYRIEGASLRADADALALRCGSLRFRAVHGIATVENTATFSYERELIPEPRVTDVVAACCGFQLPRAGVATRERTARRDDEGNWSLVSLPPGR